MIAHALLSWKARFVPLFRRDARAPRRRGRAPAPAAAHRAALRRPRPRRGAEHGARATTEDDDDEDDAAGAAPHAPRRAARPRARSRRRLRAALAQSAGRADAPPSARTLPKDVIDANATALESVLGDFGVRGEIINARPGPVVTLYELEPAPGIKSSRVIGLADDIARSMSALSARVAVVSGRNAIGIELPNPTREKVYLRELLSADDYTETRGQAAALPRQDHRRRAGDRRSRAHAASADRRHHRLRQVGRHQHHDPVAALPAARPTSAG